MTGASPIRGMLTIDELQRLVNADEIDTVIVSFTDPYGRQLGKRVDAGFFLDEVACSGTHACDYLLTADMEMEPVAGYAFANWESGYGDVHLVPDLATLRRATWLQATALVICDLADEATHERVAVAPRTILRRQLERAGSLGLRAALASELEYFLFQDTYADAARKGYSGLSPVGWYIEDYHLLQGSREESFNGPARRHLRDSGIPVESSKGEWGRGQHELNVRHADGLTMADRHVVYKQCLKDLADQLGCAVTFMAKPHAEEAGSSCHVHISLWRDDEPVFPGATAIGGIRASDEFRWFLGGWLRYVPDLMVFYAPTVNSYKRFQDGSWAPTRLAWSRDNRTAGFRIVGAGPSLRIECRIPGADCNPYLAFAATLAAGLTGIEQRIEPPDAFAGDAYGAGELPRVPVGLDEATDLFAGSPFIAEALGPQVRDHYTRFFRAEQEAWQTAVTDWERRRYFERI